MFFCFTARRAGLACKLLMLACLICAGTPTSAQLAPILDLAGVLNPEDESEISVIAQRLGSELNLHLAVVTLENSEPGSINSAFESLTNQQLSGVMDRHLVLGWSKDRNDVFLSTGAALDSGIRQELAAHTARQFAALRTGNDISTTLKIVTDKLATQSLKMLSPRPPALLMEGGLIFDAEYRLNNAEIAVVQERITRLYSKFDTPAAVLLMDASRDSEIGKTLISQAAGLLRDANHTDQMLILVASTTDQNLWLLFGESWQATDRLIGLRRISQDVGGAVDDAETLMAASDELLSLVRIRDNPAYRFLDMAQQKWRALGQLLLSPNLSSWLTFLSLNILLAVGLLVVLEKIFPWRKNQRRTELRLDLFYTFLQKPLFFALFGGAVVGITDFLFRQALFQLFGLENLVAIRLERLPVWLQYILLFLLIDCLSYWGHRMLHASDTLWQLHEVHHSAKQLHVLNAIRQHYGEDLFYRLFAYVPAGLFGFGVEMTIYAILLQSLLSFYTHANVRLPLGPLKYLINNPQMHIWHHTDIQGRGNVNFGDALSIWDFLFRTAYLPGPKQGVDKDFTGEDLQLGFEGIEEYPQKFSGQFMQPFKDVFTLKFRGKHTSAAAVPEN